MDVWRLIANKTEGHSDIGRLRHTCKQLKGGLKLLHFSRLHRWCYHKIKWVNARYKMLKFEDWYDMRFDHSVSSMRTLWQRQIGKPLNKALLLVLMANIYEAYINIWDHYVRKCDKMVSLYRDKTQVIRYFIENFASILDGTYLTKTSGSEIVCNFRSDCAFYLDSKHHKENLSRFIFWQARKSEMAQELAKKSQHLARLEEAVRKRLLVMNEIVVAKS